MLTGEGISSRIRKTPVHTFQHGGDNTGGRFNQSPAHDDAERGQQQRAALARILASRPRALLLDEPFSALDFLTRISMQEWLLGQWEKHKKTILFITHDVEEAVFLSGSVLAVTSTPIHALTEVPVPADYPRTRECLTHPDMVALREDLINVLRKQVAP